MRLPSTFLLLASALLASALLGSCDDTTFGEPKGGSTGSGDDGGTDDGGTDDGGTDDTASSEEGWCAVQNLFVAQCTVCHGTSGDLDLATAPYAALVNQPASTDASLTLVVPGNPEASFLYVKAAGTQGAGQGTEMPPNKGVDAAGLQVIYDWIAAGASEECSEVIDTGTGSYHPEGFELSTEHGMEAKLQQQDCTSCHGSTLEGTDSAPSCDSCHEAGWRTDCTFCHGGDDNLTGAPPEHISDTDESSTAAFGPHSAHVQDTSLHAAFDCTQCHVKPTDILSTGHIFVGDSTPGVAETDLSAGLSDAGSWSGTTCSNLYCHGNGQGDNGSISGQGNVSGCASCHPGMNSSDDVKDTMSGRHKDHLENGIACADCHGATTTNSTAIADITLHVNGTADLALHTGMSNTGTTCTGTCHAEVHSNRSWY